MNVRNIIWGTALKDEVVMDIKYLLGGFDLTFDSSGKLKELLFDKTNSILNKSDYCIILENKQKFFIEGWDECFPNIAPFGDNPRLGKIIRYKPIINKASDYSVRQRWTTDEFIAERKFESEEPGDLTMTFNVLNLKDTAIEFLWASHALYDLAGIIEIKLPSGGVLKEFFLNDSSSKFFVEAKEPLVIVKKEILITLGTNQPYWGIWLNRGGWPLDACAGFGCIGIEATNCASEAPRGDFLQAKSNFKGEVRLNIKYR